MIAAGLFVLAGSLAWNPACPVAATSALPELVGTWQVLMVAGLDRPRPDSTRGESIIAPDLQDCLLEERLRAPTGRQAYEARILWGANGADSAAVQRVFAHAHHGRFGIYQGRRAGAELLLRQANLSPQPEGVVVENRVVIRDRDHFSITSRLSSDGGRTWADLSRWEYRR